MKKGLPQATLLQYAVLCKLGDGESSGALIRKQLEEVGIELEGPGFYQMMQRLEKVGWIKSSTMVIQEDYGKFKASYYTCTAKGREVRQYFKSFVHKVEATPIN